MKNFLLFLLLLFPINLYAETHPFVIGEDFEKSFHINPIYIQQIDQRLNEHNIQSFIDENQWESLDNIDKGFTDKSYLLKIPIKNLQDNKQFTLFIDWHYLDNVTLFTITTVKYDESIV